MGRQRRTDRYELLLARLVEARTRSGFSQAEVARRLERPQSFVSKYERGERRLDVVELLEVCEALGLQAEAVVRELSTRGRVRGGRKR